MGSVPWLPFFNHRDGAAGGCPAGLISMCARRSDFDCRMLPSESTPALLELQAIAQRKYQHRECEPGGNVVIRLDDIDVPRLATAAA